MTNALRRNAFGVWNGYAPSPGSGPKVLPYRFDFSDVSEIRDDLLNENTLNVMQFVQGIYVDNSDNAVAFEITFLVTNQRIVVPANSQGTYMVLAPDQTQFIARMAALPGRIVDVLFMNVPTAYTQWGPVTVNTVPIEPVAANLTDFSITNLTGASETLIPANAARKGYIIENPVTNNDSIWINFGAAAVNDATSFELSPGGFFPPNGSFVFTQQEITVIGTAGEGATAKEFA